jgi:hypothetical protein
MTDVMDPTTPGLGDDATPEAASGGSQNEDPDFVEAPTEDEVSVIRLGMAVALPVIGAAVMVGGVFDGFDSRIWAGIAGLLGIVLAGFVRRFNRPAVTNLMIALGIFAIGLVMVIPTGIDNVARAGSLAREAAASGDVLRPPVPFTAGWHAIVGWLMGIVGFASMWLAVVLRKSSLALLVPLPVAAISAISVPDNAQVPSGIVVLVLFAVALGLLSSARQYEEGARPPLSYELRKFARSVPLIGVITVALVFLAQTDFLFPDPQIDPAEEPQKPKVKPLNEVEDRVLFQVRNPDGGAPSVSGPWRIGTLDVYDGIDWRLPAFNDASLADLEDDGIVDEEAYARRGVKADFKILGLGGAALPGTPNLAAVVARGPKLQYDERTGTLRVASGQAVAGLRYTVASASLPKIDELKVLDDDVPAGLEPFVEIPDPPPAVQALLDEATSRFTNQWEQFDYLRNHVLDNVTAAGAGSPVAIPPSRVQDILGDTLEASPFEIVAMQAMLGRWVGLPSRIGYGFDGGELVNDTLEIRPRHGASFPEVYFEGFGWLPVIGMPKMAKPTVGSDPTNQQRDASIQPSPNVGVPLYFPELLPPASTTGDNVKIGALIAVLLLLLFAVVYVATPAVRKSIIRGRRREAAREAGPRARVALAYSEWRDMATDFGYRHATDTPLMFLERFVDDAEHAELAWLTTRVIWGDLRTTATDDHAAAAEELSRALRQRLSSSQPASMRFVAAVSRLSLKDPYAPETDLTRRRRRRKDAVVTTPPTPTSASSPASLDVDDEAPEEELINA